MTDDTHDTTGAIDNDYGDAERDYAEQVADALADVRTELVPGSVAIDLVTRQLVFVREEAYPTCADHYEAEGYDLCTYKMHPWLSVTPDDSVYEVAFLDGNPENVHKTGRTYDYPASRLIPVPVEQAWNEAEVGDL